MKMLMWISFVLEKGLKASLVPRVNALIIKLLK